MNADDASGSHLGRAETVTRKTLRRPRRRPGAARHPRVTVVIPCYNYGRYLTDAVDSALSQGGVEVDVIVVDDHSTDDSLEVARRLADTDSRVQVIAHSTNRGAVETFNDGLAAATGDYLVRLDADDLLTPGSLQRSTDLAQAHPSVGLVYGRPRHFEGRPPARLRSRVDGWIVWPGRRWLMDRTRDALNVITSPEALMRMSVVRRVGGQLPLKHTHDMEMWFRLAGFSDVGYVIGADQALHRDHAGSLSTAMTDPLDDFKQRRAAFEALVSGPVGDLPEATALRTAAARTIADQALTSAVHTFDRQQIDEPLVERLIEFAVSTYPAARSLPRWKGLQRRRELGAAGVRRRPWYLASARARRLRTIARGIVWERLGTYDGR